MQIRKFQASDREPIKVITAICFEGVSVDHAIEQRHGLVNGHDWRYRKVRHIDSDIAANADGIFVAVVQDAPTAESLVQGVEEVEPLQAQMTEQVIGYITTRIDHDTLIGGIPNLGVLPAYRGQGIGRKLIETAIAYAKAQGMAFVRIETLAHNAIGQTLYPSCGFVEVARQVHYVLPLDDLREEEK
ncbi:MAG: GNAT family N-acetyltransferase [Caldilineaceae bacterium]